MAERLNFFTPVVGRYVSGDHLSLRTKDNENRPIDPADQRFEFGVAFNKAEIWPMLAEVWYPALAQQLAADQNGLTRLNNWFSTLSGFSMKVSDGDKPNGKGKVNENTKGCFVLYFSNYNESPPKVCVETVEIDPKRLKRGDFVQIAGTIKPNEQPNDRAGVYLDAQWIRLVAEGDAIVGGVDAETAFGGSAAPAVLPPGARPISSAAPAFGGVPNAAPAGVPGLPVAQSALVQMPGAPVGAPGLPGVLPGTVSPGNVQPHTAILNGPPRMPGS